jgi:VWFA-related protein
MTSFQGMLKDDRTILPLGATAMHSLPQTFAVVPWAFAALLTPCSFAQDVFIDRIDVNVVNVEVFVTDQNGRPVGGLTEEDFEIFEDGRLVEISNFYATVQPGIEDDWERDRALVTGERAPKVLPRPEDQRLHLLVYVDHFNLHSSHRQRVLDKLEGFLEDRVAQKDRVMLVGYDRSLDIVQPFTGDRRALKAGIETLGKVVTHRQNELAQRRQVMRLMDMADLPTAHGHVRSYTESLRSDLRHSMTALGQVVRSMAGLPGRKAILYVSDGLPQRPGEELYEHLANLFDQQTFADLGGVSGGSDPSIEALQLDESKLFSEITREANAHQVTFYTLDARGAAGESTLSAEHDSLGAGPGGRTNFDNLRTANLQQPLIEMAEATGGSSILNTFNFDRAFADLAEDFDRSYSLGYRSSHGGDGAYHKIEVKVRRSGLKTRHRTGFVDKPQSERVADRTLSSLMLDLSTNPLGIAVDFGPVEKKSRNRFILPVLVRVPIREITLLPGAEKEEGRLSFFLVVRDREGGISDLHQAPYPVIIPQGQAATAQDQEIGYGVNLEVRAGTPRVAVGVWDELSGSESFVYKEVQVGEQKGRKREAGR